MLTGYDLSDYQTVGQGTDRAFAIVKASEGKGGRMARHDAHVAALRAAGRLVGHYHFAWPVNGGQADAANFLACAKAQPGDVLALDWEPYGPSGVGVTPAMAFPYVRDFATAVRSATGAWPWFYTNDDQLTKIRAAISMSDWAWLITTLPLWKAGVGGLYVSDPAKGPGSVYGFLRVAAFQWSQTPIDQDVFYGDAALWRALAVPEEGDMALTPEERKILDDLASNVRELLNVARTGRRDGDTKVWPYSFTPAAEMLNRLESLLNRPAPAPVDLSAADVQRIAVAVADEQARRQQA